MPRTIKSKIPIGYPIDCDCSVTDGLKVKLGTVNKDAEPLLIDRSTLHSGHMHVRGRTRSGKTSRTLIPMVQRLASPYEIWDSETEKIIKPDAKDAIFVFDLGGDSNLLRTAKAAASIDREFRYLSLDPTERWNTFDPLQSMHENARSPIAITEFLIQAFSLDYGLMYGGSYFTQRNMSALLAVANDLDGENASLQSVVERLERQSIKDADQIKMCLQFLFQYDQLRNYEGIEKIDFSRAIENSEIVYFNTPMISGANSARQIAGLGLYSAVLAAMERTRQCLDKRNIFIVIDEFQELAGKSFANLLAQSAKFGISLILANQTTSQLDHRDGSLADIVSDNTIIKQYYSVTTQRDIESLQMFSMDEISSLKSTAFRDGLANTTTRELIVPRLKKNVALAISQTEGYSFLLLDDGSGQRDPIPLFSDYGLDTEIFELPFKMDERSPEDLEKLLPTVGLTVPFKTKSQWSPSGDAENPDFQLRQSRLKALWDREDLSYER